MAALFAFLFCLNTLLVYTEGQLLWGEMGLCLSLQFLPVRMVM